jgi:ubiquinone/menaquinone biosynthesis C-methylase UbiE
MNSLEVFMQRNYFYAQYRKWWIEKAISRFFKVFGDDLAGKRILEIGCGSGYGAQVIDQFFRPAELVATDLDPRLISKAKARVNAPTIQFAVADATRLPYENERYDAIFDFGAIHHIPDWPTCLSELRRVVRDGGRIFLIESPIESFKGFLGRIARLNPSHPYGEMFSEVEFIARLRELGFKVILKDVFRPNLYYFVVVLEK